MSKIDNEIIQAFLNCSYKAFQKYHNLIGSKTEYELLESELLQRYKATFFNKLYAKSNEIQILDKPELKNDINYQKKTYAIEPLFKSSQYLINFDVLEVYSLEDSSESSSYIPIAISPKEKIFATDKILLATKSLLLGQLNEIFPEYGKIIYGRNLRTTKFSLKPYFHKAKQVIKDLSRIRNGESPPKYFHNSHCQVCEYQNICYTKLLKKGDISLLGNIGQKVVSKLNNKGIFTIHQFSYTYRPKKRKSKSVGPQRVEYSLKALALREKQTYIIEIPTLLASKIEVYIDIEGLSDENFFYLIGVLVLQNGIKNQFSFWANSEDDVETMFTHFLDTLLPLQEFTIYHYGSYDVHALRKINKILNNRFDKELGLIEEKSINILSLFSSHIYPPTYTNSLKDIAHYIGFKWTDSKASGIQCLVWRKKWELTNGNTYKNKIIQYNSDDCEALYSVKEWIGSVKEKPSTNEDANFAKTSDIERRNYQKWGDPNFQTTEFEEINKYSYFDYQRNRIYLRTNEGIKKALRRAKRSTKYANKADKVLDYLPMKCPNCQHDAFYRLANSRKKIVKNLKFMKNGVKRWNVQLPGSLFQCAGCGEEFTLHNYGWDLAIWSMNQYLTYLVSIPKIDDILVENFNLYVPEGVLYQFKRNLAEEYQSTYEEIKQILIKGNLIHADETKTPVRDNPDSYVWVLASMDTVYYFYRPNREADFLTELLRDFQGVLVSDYYSGYSSLPCKQQKCLIHLIRDLNGDLLNNQLNTEYIDIVTRFGELLRKIIGTIDRYGLKKIHLRKHKKDVEAFFKHILNEDYETELAIKWQKRFKRNKKKLFTFLNYDGIPWNNNNAENAIKPVAKYRARAKGILREQGVKDFLVLLSIQQTCKYRGINFLDFLKSGEKSIEQYCKKH